MFRFISGVLAWISARDATASRKKDAGLIDWLESRRGDSPVVLRWSSTGRGWRLHDLPAECLDGVPGTVLGGPVKTVREAIREAMLYASRRATGAPPSLGDVWSSWPKGDGYGPASRITDSQMLDWLDCLSGEYTGRVIWRLSTTRPGWILHETSLRGATPSVREAIRNAIGSFP